MRVLLTGGTGFVGQALARSLASRSDLLLAIRRDHLREVSGRPFYFDALESPTDWYPVLSGVDVVVHAAARVHVMGESSADSLAAYRKANVDGSLNLARQAASAGARRFVFLSSIKVNGEETAPGRPFRANQYPAPEDPYGVSKMEAEQGLRQLALKTGMEVVIIRPPLVYGPGVGANFLTMMRYLYKRVPLPLGAIHNSRSLVALDNLVDLVVRCLDHPAAADQTFLVSDGDDLSTTELLQRLGKAMNRPARLIPVPSGLLEAGARLAGKQDFARRLLGSLQVDISHTHELLGWRPVVTVDEGLRFAAVDFLSRTVS